jgi:hypothetical protein
MTRPLLWLYDRLMTRLNCCGVGVGCGCSIVVLAAAGVVGGGAATVMVLT